MSILARSVSVNIAGQAATLVIGFFSSILLARWLGPTDRGLLGVMSSLTIVCLLVAGGGIPTAVWYYASRARPPSGELLGTSLVYGGALLALFVPVAWFLSPVLSDAFGHGRGGYAWVLAAFGIPLAFLDYTTHNQLLGKLRFGVVSTLGVLSKAVYLLGIVVLLGALGFGITGSLLSGIASSLVMVVGSLAFVVRFAHPSFSQRRLRQLWRYGVRSQVAAIFQHANYRMDILVLQFFLPLASVGYYVVAQTLAELVLTVTLAFQGSVLSLVSHFEGDVRQRETTGMSLRHHAILATAAIVFNAFFAPLMIVFGYGLAYRSSLIPMFILLPAMLFVGTGNVVTSDLSGRGRPGLSSALTGLGALATIGLDLALIPSFGIVGAAVASLVGYSIFGVASVIVLARVAEIPLREVLPRISDVAVYPVAARGMIGRVLRPSTKR